MADWNQIRAELTNWLGWAPGERWRGYELSVDLAGDIQTDRMLLELDMYKFVRRPHAIGFSLACAYFDKTTKRDRLEIHFGDDAATEVDWQDVRDPLLDCNLNLAQQGMPVLSCSVVGGIRTARFYRDGEVVGTMWSERFVALLDDFYVNKSDRIEEPDDS